MDAHTLARRGGWARIDSPDLARLGRVMALTWLAVLAACALVITLRRLEGALVEPLRPGVMAVTGFALVLATAAARGRCSGAGPPRRPNGG